VNALIRAAADLQAVCEANQWRFCFIGGLAVLRWGEPRETIDVDLTLITGFGRERAFVSEEESTDANRSRLPTAGDDGGAIPFQLGGRGARGAAAGIDLPRRRR
jgi:hypothetical protein